MNRIEFIAQYYGKRNQEIKTKEEIDEFLYELYNNMMTGEVSENTPSEIADVSIMLNQLIYLYNIGDEVEKEIEFKLKRQIDRIKNTKY